MEIEDIELITISYEQTVLADEGFFQCWGYAPDQLRVIITDAFTRRMDPLIELCTTLNHEYLHIILEELVDLEASMGLDNIDVFDIDEVTL